MTFTKLHQNKFAENVTAKTIQTIPNHYSN